MVSVGYHACAVLEGGSVRCWGYNFFGALGLGHTSHIGDNELPTVAPLVSIGGPAVAVSAGFLHTCALLQSGEVRCWGYNGAGDLGLGHSRMIGDYELPSSASAVSLGGVATSVSVCQHTCALLDNGTVRCWGFNDYGALGLGHTDNVGDNELPSSVDPVSVGGSAVLVSAGMFHTCVILTAGEVRCWGVNNYGQLGLGHTNWIGDDELPDSEVAVSLGRPATSVSGGLYHTCALLDNGDVRCWGDSDNGQLGLGHTDLIGDDELPSSIDPISLGGPAVAVSIGGKHSCALMSGGGVRCWGWNGEGQLGLGHTRHLGDDELPSSAPMIALGAPAISLSAGWEHSCVTLDGGGVRCWGRNSNGELGLGHTTHIGDDELPESVWPADIVRATDVPLDSNTTQMMCQSRWMKRFVANARGLERVAVGVFHDLPFLEIVDLRSNPITSVHPYAFSEAAPFVTSVLLDSYDCPPFHHQLNATVGQATVPVCLGNETPAVSHAQSSVLPQSGGARFNMTGSFLFGPRLTTLWVGRYQCPQFSASADFTAVTCHNSPVGAGGPHQVVLRFSDESESESSAFVSFEPAVITSLAPAFVFPTLESNLSFSILGSNFGHSRLDVSNLTIGGNPCLDLEWHSSTRITCHAVRGFFTSKDVVLFQGEVRSTGGDQRLAFADPPVALVALPPVIPPTGFVNITFIVSNLPSNRSLLRRVNIGPFTCLELELLSAFQLRCLAPPGSGADHFVTIITSGGIVSVSSTPIVDYRSPEIASIDPRIAFSDPSHNYTFDLTGAHFGPEPRYLESVAVGGQPCDPFEWVSDSLVRCVNVSAPWASTDVAVTVAGQTSITSTLFSFLPLPFISAVAPSTPLPTLGHINVTLIGGGFGGSIADVAGVFVGARPCLSFAFVSDSELTCEVPPGVGTGLSVEVATHRNGRSPPNELLSYNPPSILSVSAPHLFLGPGPIDPIELLVADAGSDPADIDSLELRIGPTWRTSCGSLVSLSPPFNPITRLSCLNLSLASAPLDDPSLTTASFVLRVANQSSLTTPSIPLISRPSVTSISSLEADPGDLIVLVGANVGFQQSDIIAATLGPYACTAVFLSPSSLSIAMPTPPADADPRSLLDMPLVVTTRGELSSAPVTLSFRGAGALPELPTHVRAWRPVGQSESLVITWQHRTPSEAPSDPVTPVDRILPAEPTSFDLHIVDLHPTNRSELSLALSVSAIRVRMAPVDLNGPTTFQHSLAVFTRFPVIVQIRAVNPTGPSAWTAFSSMTPETCEESEFLATHEAPHEWECRACPSGAYCGGLGSENVTALVGHWRVPWSADRLGFAACARLEACEGWGDRSDIISHHLDEESPFFVAPSAVPGLRLETTTQEQCRDGHTGVLCASCEAGFYRGVGGLCQPCGSQTDTLLRLAGVILLVTVVLGGLLARTYAVTGSATSNSVVRVLKILFNHFQTISIIAAIDFEWPGSVRSTMDVTNGVSAFSTEGVSLECVTGSAGQDPLGRSLIMLSTPLWLLLYAALFWALEVQFDACTACAVRLRRCKRRLRPRRLGRKEDISPPVSTHNPLASVRASIAGASAARAAEASPRRYSLNPNIAGNDRPLTRWIRRMQVSIPVLLFLVHTSVSKAAFQMLTCRSVTPLDDPSSSQLRLVMDLETRCDDPASLTWMLGVGIPVVVFFSLGLPVATSLLLGLRPKQLNTETMKRALGFLYLGFKPEYAWWEGVNLIRKVLLAGVTVLLRPAGAFNQVGASLVVLLAFSYAHSWLKPYVDERLNRLEMLSLVVSAITMIAGLFIEASSVTAVRQIVAPVFIFVSNGVLVGVVARHVFVVGAVMIAAGFASMTDGMVSDMTSMPTQMPVKGAPPRRPTSRGRPSVALGLLQPNPLRPHAGRPDFSASGSGPDRTRANPVRAAAQDAITIRT